MDKNKAKALGQDVMTALEAVAAKHGLTVELRGGAFDSVIGTFTPRVMFKEAASGAAQWQRYAAAFGLDPEGFGKAFEVRGLTYTIVGIRPSASRRPVLAALPDGRQFAFEIDAINRALGFKVSTHSMEALR